MQAWETYSDHINRVRELLLKNYSEADLENQPIIETSAHDWMLENEDVINDCEPCVMHDGKQDENWNSIQEWPSMKITV